MDYDFEKLGQEIVSERMKDVESPYALAGEVVRLVAVPAVASTRDRQDPRHTLAGVCRGVARGMLLLERDLAKTTVAILIETAAIAQETHLDPAECMTWAMEGLAPVCRLAPGGHERVRDAIEEHFMGAGAVFEGLVRG